MRSFCCLLGLVVGLCGPAGRTAEQSWQISGTLVGLKPGTSSVVVIELADKSRIEVPLAALSEADQQVVRSRLEVPRPAASVSGTVTVRGPTGRVTLTVPESLRAVETDAIWCRTAADAAKVYRLFLGPAPELSPLDREAAAARVAEWAKRAKEKRVRMGDVWLPPEQRAQTRRAAHDQLLHAIEVIRLGNWTLAEDELKKASRLDPDLATADLVHGLGYFLLRPKVPGDAGPNLVKATDLFVEAVRREPDNVNALNDLGLAEMFGGKYAGGVAHLVRAAELAVDDQVIADNLGLVIREAAGLRPKLPEKLLAELNDCYRSALRNPLLKPLTPGAVLMLKSPFGQPIAAVKGALNVADFARQLAEPAEWIAESQTGQAAVVGDGFVITALPLVSEATEIFVEDPTAPGRQLAAREVASSGDSGLFLLRCDGLIAKPFSLAAKGPAEGEEVSIWGVPAAGPLRAAAEPVRGRIVVAGSGAGAADGLQAFIHSGAVARGPGGGPIVDRHGRLVGFETPLPKTDAIGHEHGMGLPIDEAWPLLREQLPNVTAVSPGGVPPADWALADARLESGSVVVTCRRKVSGQPPK